MPEDEPATGGWVTKILLPTETAFSYLGLPENELPRLQQLIDHMSLLNDEKNYSDYQRAKVWIGGLAFLASLRSEDEDLQVGSVLAKLDQSHIEIFGVGYNGTKTGALHGDYPQHDKNKGKWSLHAEQNTIMFRCVDDISNCHLFTTHSPCFQCSCLITDLRIKKVIYIDHYRPPCFLPEGMLEALEDEHLKKAVCPTNEEKKEPNARRKLENVYEKGKHQ